MRRRAFLAASAAGLVALIGAGVWSRVPVIPKRPGPDAGAAMGWIAWRDGRYTLTLPRAEMGQNVATALRQVACAELGVSWDAVTVDLHATMMERVKATVGSESVMLFAEPLAQACAALRDALASGQLTGVVEVVPRPVSDLRALRKGGLIGASPEITQGRAIVTGAPLFAADIRLPGMLYGRVLRAPAPVEVASSPLRWNIAAAAVLPGFAGVVTDCGPPIGQAQGLGILAYRPGALDAVAEALDVEWEIAGPHPLSDIGAAIDIDRQLAAGALAQGAMDNAPTEGPWDVDLRIDLPLAAHGFIEPRAAVADATGERLRVWAGTQDAFYVRDVIADAFSLRPDAVVVQSCRIGGAFGGKTICTVEAEAAALSLAAASPVKVQWTRAQEYALGFHRPPSSHRVKARVRNGRITDWNHGVMSAHVMFTSAVVPRWMQRVTDIVAGDGGVARGLVAPYVLGRARARYDMARLPVQTGPWRGLGAGPNGLAIECAMDEAARAAKADPLAFRLAHVTDPYLAAVIRRVGEIADWGATPVSQGGVRMGRGLAAGVYKATSHAAVVADVAVTPRGDVQVTGLWCVHDCGLIINPDQVRAQCEGNLVWSVGMILSDDLPVAGGRVVAETLADAPIPPGSAIPSMTVDLIESDRPPQGAGETVIVAGPGAIANAIRAATGVRVSRFPLRPAELAA